MKSAFSVCLASALCVAISCSDSTPSETPAPSDATEIGPEGGTVTAGDAAVEIPEGALPEATKITVAPSDVAVEPPDGYVLALRHLAQRLGDAVGRHPLHVTAPVRTTGSNRPDRSPEGASMVQRVQRPAA